MITCGIFCEEEQAFSFSFFFLFLAGCAFSSAGLAAATTLLFSRAETRYEHLTLTSAPDSTPLLSVAASRCFFRS